MRRRHLFALAAATLPPVLTAAAQAGWKPDRPVRVIVPFAPGGSTDVVARVLSEPVGALLGQPLVIENRPGGAAGLIGAEAVAKAAPDGHTILVNSNAHVVAPALVARMPYDAIEDFAAVAHLGRIPQVLVVNPRLPVTDMRSLLAWLRGREGKANFAAAGIGSANHLASEVFRAAAGVEVQMVQYRGGGPAMQAVISGEADLCIDPVASAIGHIRGGVVRPIAVAGPTRSAALRDVPSATEAGLPGFDIAAWIGAFAPAQTPPAAVAALNAAFDTAMQRIEPRLTELAIERRPELADPAAFREFLRQDAARSQEVLRKAGVRPE